MEAKDGWVGGWNMNEGLVSPYPSLASDEQIMQFANSFGYEGDQSGSPDRIYTLIDGKFDGYQYEDYVEKYVEPLTAF
jgi:hypothetical protein